MKSIQRTTILTLALAAAVGTMGAAGVYAQDTGDAGTMRIATGKKGKGYSKLFADIQSVCGGKVGISEVETEGGLHNVNALAANEADLGFVQIDTLQDMKTTDDNIGALLAVLPLNSNLLHIVARTDGFAYEGPKKYAGMVKGDAITVNFDKISDLKSMPVALVGSAQKLARVIDRRNKLGMQAVDVETDDQALAMLKAGQVAAVFSTSGWPSGVIGKLKRESNFKLLGFDLPSAAPYQVVRKNYNNLGAYNVSFLAAPNLLVSRPFKGNGVNGKAVATLQSCIAKNINTLQEGRYEAAWGEVKNVNDTYGWPRFGETGKR
jgi:TRAP-type uncharacterized transport system substrate-binding protein